MKLKSLLFVTMIAIAASAPSKKILIVYYSLTGNTKQMVDQLNTWLKEEDNTQVDVEELKTPNISNTTFSYIKIALISLWEGDIFISPTKYNINEYDHIVICCPFWMGTAALPIQTYLKTNAEKIKPETKLHILVTYGGSSISILLKAIEHLENKIDKTFLNTTFIKARELNTSISDEKLFLFKSDIREN